MKKILLFTFGLLLIPSIALAVPTSWDYTSNILRPLQSMWTSEVKVPYITATSTTATSTFPKLAVTNRFSFAGISGTTWASFCNAITGGAGLCDGIDATGGGSALSDWKKIGTTAITPTTTVGIRVSASSTIGGGTGATGLTISGGATTTGNFRVGAPFTSEGGQLRVNGSVFASDSFNIPGLTTLSLGSLYNAGTFNLKGFNGTSQVNLLNTQGAGTVNIGVNFPTGNVGIGTTTPTTKLSVQGNGLFGGNIKLSSFTATSTTASSTVNRLEVATAFKLASDYITDLTGTGITVVGNALTLVTTGDWTGLFDGQEGSYYLARANHTGTQLAATISDFVANARTSISETITGLTYTSGTGVLSIDAGREITFTASSTNWNGFYNTPSTRITAGTNLSWAGNTLNATAGAGDVVGPASATNNAVARYNLATGKIIKNSGVTIDDTDNVTVPGNINISDTNKKYQIGGQAVLYASSTNSSVLGGFGAGTALLQTGTNNTAFGHNALNAATSSDFNTAIGTDALRFNTTGTYNTAVGYNSLASSTTAVGNTGVGIHSLFRNTTGRRNVGIGFNALQANTLGSFNVAIGYGAGLEINGSSDVGSNTIIGYNTGRGIITGTDNTILGANVAGLAATLSNNIIIADGAGQQRINVGSTGLVGIGTTTPFQKLTVGGGAFIRGSATTTGDVSFMGEIKPDGLTCTNGQILKKTGANDWDCAADNSGGAPTWDTIGDAAANGSVLMAETIQSLDWDTGAVTAIAGDYFTLTSQNDATTDITTQRLFVLDNKALSTNAIEVMQRITNSDAVAVVTGLLIDGAGAFTTAIDVSAAAIVTALSAGANDLTGTNWNIAGATGALTLGTPLTAGNGGTGLNALGAGVATWLGTPSSANLATAVTDETGSGALVFGTSPTLSSTTISGILKLSGQTASRGLFTDAQSRATTTALSATLLNSLTDETGTGVAVFSASPTFTGTVTLPAGQVVNGVTLLSAGGSANYLNGNGAYVVFDTAVRGAILTGLSLVSTTVISATDTVLVALGSLQAQITALTTTVSSKAPLASPTFTTNITLGADTISDFTGLGLGLATGALGLNATGATDEFCLTYEGTGPTTEWQTCGGAGGSLFTDAGTFTYLTATTDDFVIGGTATATAPFWWDESATTTYIGNGGALLDSTTQYGKNDMAWTIGADISDGSKFKISSSTSLGINDFFTITKTGLVGVGTSTPAKKLSVAGDFRLTGAIFDSLNSAGTSGQLLSSTVTGTAWRNPTQYNTSVTSQTGFAADTYLVGSSIAIPAGSLKAKTSYACRFNVVKSAAGTATPIINVRIGTAGSTADASRGTLTFSAQTAVVDEGTFTLNIIFRTVGAGTSAVLQSLAKLDHRLSITGLGVGVSEAEIATSAGFDSTVANSIIGLSVNGGASAAWTINVVSCELQNLN